MGRITSTMTLEDDGGSSSVLSNLAIAGDVPAVLVYFQGHPDADVNARDENVSLRPQRSLVCVC